MAKCSCFLSCSLKYRKGVYIISFISFCGLCRPSNEKDHLGTFKLRPFPSTYFYAFLGRGAALYEKAHHRLSLSSFPAVSSRKDRQANLVSFMLVKVLNDHPINIGLTFSGLIGLPIIKKSLIPSRMGELSYVYLYPFSSIGDYQ